jgi:hypothetical protein
VQLTSGIGKNKESLPFFSIAKPDLSNNYNNNLFYCAQDGYYMQSASYTNPADTYVYRM